AAERAAGADEVSTTDAAMAPAIGPIFPEDAVTHPRIKLPSQSELDLLADEATRTYPRRLVAAALGLADHGEPAAAAAAAREAADASDAEEAAIARTPTPLLASRTATPLMPGRAILGAPDASAPSLSAISDADFERDLEEALGAAAEELGGSVSPRPPVDAAAALEAAQEGAVDAVPTAIGDDGFDDDLDLDLPPPVADDGAA